MTLQLKLKISFYVIQLFFPWEKLKVNGSVTTWYKTLNNNNQFLRNIKVNGVIETLILILII